jgi:hypothetical protein
MTAAQLVVKSRDALDDWRTDPTAPEAARRLADAGAYLKQALQRIADDEANETAGGPQQNWQDFNGRRRTRAEPKSASAPMD